MKDRMTRYTFKKLRVRSRVYGTGERPRLSVYRSLKHIYAQVINDLEGKTIAMASSREKGMGEIAGVKAAQKIGGLVGERAIKHGVSTVVFDRGARSYHGRVKAVADGAREAGLKF